MISDTKAANSLGLPYRFGNKLLGASGTSDLLTIGVSNYLPISIAMYGYDMSYQMALELYS